MNALSLLGFINLLVAGFALGLGWGVAWVIFRLMKAAPPPP